MLNKLIKIKNNEIYYAITKVILSVIAFFIVIKWTNKYDTEKLYYALCIVVFSIFAIIIYFNKNKIGTVNLKSDIVLKVVISIFILFFRFFYYPYFENSILNNISEMLFVIVMLNDGNEMTLFNRKVRIEFFVNFSLCVGLIFSVIRLLRYLFSWELSLLFFDIFIFELVFALGYLFIFICKKISLDKKLVKNLILCNWLVCLVLIFIFNFAINFKFDITPLNSNLYKLFECLNMLFLFQFITEKAIVNDNVN